MAKQEFKQKRVMSREEFPYEWEVIENIWVPMSDGCRCSARMWKPKSDKPLPTIFETQPYRKRDGMRGRRTDVRILRWNGIQRCPRGHARCRRIR